MEVRAAGAEWPLAPAVESALLRVAQEALANTVKHASATSARIVLRYAEVGVMLEVADDGQGFSEEMMIQRVLPGPLRGFGLLGMEERVRALGGELRLSNQGAPASALPCPAP